MDLYWRALTAEAVAAAFSDEALLAAMVRFELCLARAQARRGVIPAEAAAAIEQQGSNLRVEPRALAREAANAGSLAIPFVEALTAHVSRHAGAAARFVHYGTTSQDLLDTAAVLCTKPVVQCLDAALARAIRAAAALARRHAATPILARTLMQPAGITSLGFKAAQWARALANVRERVVASARTGLAVALGGAIGNLAAYGERGEGVRAELAAALELHDPGASWHTHRERWMALAADTALAAASMHKIARDVALMGQAEVGEVREPNAAGRGGSTAMPHKRNPVLSMRVVAATQPLPGVMANLLAAMAQEHERALGTWQAELAQWPVLFIGTASAAEALAELLEGLQVDAARCQRNIDGLQGVVFAAELAELLAPALGKSEAHETVARLSQRTRDEGVHLHELASALPSEDPRLAGCTPADLDRIFDVERAAHASARLVPGLLVDLV